MADFPTFDQLFRIARDQALINNSLLTLQSIERPGTDANILVASATAAADEVVSQLIAVTASLFLDSATGKALDRLVFDRYGLTRKPASAALGTVEFSTVAASPATFLIPAGTRVGTATGVQFVTTAAATFPIGSTGPLSVPVASTLAGSDQQASSGTITSILSQIAGSPTDLVVSNPLATAGADDAETDTALRARAQQFFVTARRGTKSAIINGALAIPGVRTATLFETIGGNNEPARGVQLIISDSFTEQLANLATVPPTYAAQSQALAAQVFLGLDEVRAAGINVQVIVAQVVLVPIILHLTFKAGVDTTAVTAQAKAAVVAYCNALAPGETFSVAAAQARLATIYGLFLTGNEISSPNGDIVPTALQVLRTQSAIVTAPAV